METNHHKMPYLPRPFCDICILWFPTIHDLKLHYTSDPVHTPHACEPCKVRFSTLFELQKHQMECGVYWRNQNGGFCENCLIWCEGGKGGLEEHQLQVGCDIQESEIDFVPQKGDTGIAANKQEGPQTPSSHMGSSTSLDDGQNANQVNVLEGQPTHEKLEQISRWRNSFETEDIDLKENVGDRIENPGERELQQVERSLSASTCTLGADLQTC